MSNGPWGNYSNKKTFNMGKVFNLDFDYFLNSNGINPRYILIIFLVSLILWLSKGFYVVEPNEEGVELRFGTYKSTTIPGLHYHFPYPFETVIKVDVTTINYEEIGYNSQNPNTIILKESLMLTGDENITDINFEVQWKVQSAKDYLFNLKDSRKGSTIKTIAESVMREIIGRSTMSYAIEGAGRAEIASDAMRKIQNIVNEYKMGVAIMSVQMKKIDPPIRVIESFRAVQSARANKASTINEAIAYSNEILPGARGKSERIINEAAAYKAEKINRATGESERFLSIYKQYVNDKYTIRERMHLQILEDVFNSAEIAILDNKVLTMASVNQLFGAK